MTTMQQLTFVSPGTLEWREVAAPKLAGKGEAIVRPIAVTRCDLDLYIATGYFRLPGPFAFGHEIAAQVVEVGEDVTVAAVGDRVIVPFQINCGCCSMCQRGFTNACEQVPPSSAYGLAPICGQEWGGGLADFLKVPFANAMLVQVPDQLSMASAAAFADNATDGYRTVAEPLRRFPGAAVLVVGGLAQSVGLYAVGAAVALGASRIVYRDFDESRLAQAKAMGAEVIATSYDVNMPVEEKFQIVVEAAGLPAALVFALRSTAPCGICTAVSAGTAADAEIPLRTMYAQGITFQVGRVQARADLHEAMHCAVCSGQHPDALISRSVPFCDAADAMTASETKIVFVQDEIE